MNNTKGRLHFRATIDTTDVKTKLKQMRQDIIDSGNTAEEQGSKIEGMFKRMAVGAGAAFSIGAIKQFGMELINITGQFQTFEAVLTNTLQSPAKARQAMKMLQDFAATTPFQVDALTGAFVKLANQGFIPTRTEMMKLGDLASSTGKGFEQLAEAIIDAQTGEFERLKEFGIRASKDGDAVTFTFKEQQTQVDFTASSIRDYILSLGDLKGVTGANTEIAKTLTGQYSNLQDTITQTMNKIGQSSDGMLSGAISGTAYLVEHYEEIGRVIGVLIASYGTYKAAVIAYAVAQKLAVSAGNIKAFFDLAKGIKTAKDAQIALNLAMGANPLIKLASIIMTVGGLIWAFARNSEDATEEVTGLNKALKDAGAEFEKESAKVQALQGVMNNSKVAYDERKRALNELKSIIPGYNAELNNEGILINNNTSAIKEYLVQLEKQIHLKAIQEEKEDAIRQKRQQEKQLAIYKKELQDAESYNSLVARPAVTSKVGTSGMQAIAMGAGSGAAKPTAGIKHNIEELNKELTKTNGTLAELDGEFISTSNSVGKGDKSVKSFSEQVQAAASEITKLKTTLVELKAGRGESEDFAKDITETDKALKEAQAKYDLLLGIDAKYLKEKKSVLEKAEKAYKDMATDADNDLFNEEIALKRKQITDKVKLIEFDRDTAIAAIEAEKQAYLQLAVASGVKLSDVDTSAYDNRIKTVTLSAKLDTDNAGLEEADKVKKELEALKQEFETFEQERTRIQAEYAAKRKKMYEEDGKTLKQGFTQGNVDELNKQQNKALADLDTSISDSTGLWSSLFENFAYKSKKDLTEIAENARNVLEYVNNTPVDKIEGKFGMSAEQLKALKNDVTGFASAYERLNEIESSANSKNPFSALVKGAENYKKSLARVDAAKKALEGTKKNPKASNKEIKDAEDAVKKAEEASGKIKANLKEAVANIGQEMSQIGDAFQQAGESLGNDTLADVGQALSLIGDTASKLASGDYLGAALGLFTAWAEAEGRHRKALEEVMNSKIAQQREYNLLLLEQNLLYEQGTTIFGTDEYGKAINAVKNYKDALSQLGKAMEGTNEQKDAQKKKNNFLSRFFGVNDPKAALKEQYAGLADMQIVTGHKKTGLFGWGKGKDTYSSILSVYPELIDSQGKFDAKLAETIISTRKMDDVTKASLQNCIDLSNQYEDAMQQVKDYLTDIFGELGGTMSDALADAFKNGTDAAEAFADSVSDMLENLAKQMVYSITIAPLMEKAQKKMLEVMDDDTLSEEEKFKRQAEILSGLTKEAITQQGKANELYKIAQDIAAGQGIDIFQPDEKEREASKKGFASMSQNSADELNGRFTAIQGHTFELNENVKGMLPNITSIKDSMNFIRDNAAQQLEALHGIRDNTTPIVEMSTEIKYMRTAVETIRDKGLAIKK